MWIRCGDSTADEWTPDKRVRAGDSWLRGGGPGGAVRGGDVNRWPDEQNDRANR